MTEAQITLLEMIRCLLNGKEYTVDVANLSEVAAYAHRQGLGYILGLAHVGAERVEIGLYKAIAKSMNQVCAYEEIIAAFEANGIYVLPLKGIKTRTRYPNPDLRMMGDIDLLYRVGQQDKLKACMEKLGYQWMGESQKHDHYIRAPYVNVEMHRGLVSADSEYAGYYKDIWGRCRPQDGYQYVYEISLEDEFVFNIVHLTEHFKSGGIGIRLVMDVFVYNHLEMDFGYAKLELEKLGLLKFHNNLSVLAEKWFGTLEAVPPVILELEQYILGSGLFGNRKNIAALSVADSRWKFALRTCFPGYNKMKSAYLWLEKAPVLLPIAWIIRGWKVISQRKETLASQLNIFQSGDAQKGRELREFYHKCGL